MNSVQQLLCVNDAASYLGMSPSWLNKKRGEVGGPMFVKLGKRVLYEQCDLDAYVASRKIGSTLELPQLGTVTIL